MRIIPEKFKHWLNLEYLFDQLLNLLRWLWILIKTDTFAGRHAF